MVNSFGLVTHQRVSFVGSKKTCSHKPSRSSRLYQSVSTDEKTTTSFKKKNDTLQDATEVAAHSEYLHVQAMNDTNTVITNEEELESSTLPLLLSSNSGQAKPLEPDDRQAIMNAINHITNINPEPELPLAVLVQRVLDTAEDVYMHARRVPYDLGWIEAQENDVDTRPTIVVLGSGWASHALLKVADTYKLRLVVVSPSNHFVFTPMLASAAVGTVEYRSMTEAVRAANPMIDNYLEGTATKIDAKKQTVTVQLERLLEDDDAGSGGPVVELKYDKLIVGVGCKVADTRVPGAFQHALRLKTCDDARRLRQSIGEAFEYASRPDVSDETLSKKEREQRQEERRRRLTFLIVGGGPTGVELAGELSDFIYDITRPRVGAYPHLRGDVSVVLVHGGDKLVPQFDEDLSAHALQRLQSRDITVRLSTRVNQVEDGAIELLEKGGSGEVERLPVGLTVWAAGTEPVPLVQDLLTQLPPEARGEGGKIKVDAWLRCPSFDNFGSILVLGDAASFADGTESYLPQTAQVAGQQGAYAARLLDRDYDLSVTPPLLSSQDNRMNAWLKLRGLERAEGCKFKSV